MVETMTIADALTELKRISKVLPVRNRNIRRYSSKKRGNKDEVENQKKWIKEQKQSAADLIHRFTLIKLSINRSNLDTNLEFEGETFSVAEAILFKQHVHEMMTNLLESFTNETGLRQINEYSRMFGVGSGLTPEQLEKVDMVPELMYNEAEIIKEKEHYLSLYSYVDALIEKSNHNATITF